MNLCRTHCAPMLATSRLGGAGLRDVGGAHPSVSAAIHFQSSPAPESGCDVPRVRPQVRNEDFNPHPPRRAGATGLAACDLPRWRLCAPECLACEKKPLTAQGGASHKTPHGAPGNARATAGRISPCHLCISGVLEKPSNLLEVSCPIRFASSLSSPAPESGCDARGRSAWA